MCGRFYLDVRQEELQRHFALSMMPTLTPRYNIAPSQEIAAILSAKQSRRLAWLHWGLVPFWSKDKKIGYRTINARAETVESKPAFRAAFKSRRCLIPASGFFEWKAENGKQPYCIRSNKHSLIAFAGLYEHWDDGKGDSIDSCTILVTQANTRIQPVHERMPVILKPADYSIWLDPGRQDAAKLKSLLAPWPEADTVVYPIGRRINNPRNDDPQCIAPVN